MQSQTVQQMLNLHVKFDALQCRQMRTEYENMWFKLRIVLTGVNNPEESNMLFTKFDAYTYPNTHTCVQRC